MFLILIWSDLRLEHCMDSFKLTEHILADSTSEAGITPESSLLLSGQLAAWSLTDHSGWLRSSYRATDSVTLNCSLSSLPTLYVTHHLRLQGQSTTHSPVYLSLTTQLAPCPRNKQRSFAFMVQLAEEIEKINKLLTGYEILLSAMITIILNESFYYSRSKIVQSPG